MNSETATIILVGLRILEDIIKSSKEPIVDKNGNILALNLEDYKLKKADDIFKEIFGKSKEEI